MAAVWLRGKARLNKSWQRAKTQTLRAVKANQRFIFSQMMDLLNLTCCVSPGAGGREYAVTSFMANLQRTAQPLKCDKQQAFPAVCCEAVENVIRESCRFYLGTFVKCNERDLEQEYTFARDKEKNSFLLVFSTKPQGPVLFLHLAKYVQFLSSKQTHFYARLLRSQILCAQNAQRRWFCLHPRVSQTLWYQRQCSFHRVQHKTRCRQIKSTCSPKEQTRRCFPTAFLWRAGWTDTPECGPVLMMCLIKHVRP